MSLTGLRSNLAHPYLYFSREDVPAILRRAAADPSFTHVYAAIMAEAWSLRYAPVAATPPQRCREARYEVQSPHDDYLHTNAKAAFTLAFAYQMTGREEYARKSFEFTDTVCDLPTWVPTVHEFPTIYDRVHPWGARDDQVVFSYSQMTDFVVFWIAAVYDWLYPALDRRQRDRIRSALLEKAITRVRGNYDYHWWAAAYRCNWCVVCNASLGVAAIALLTEDPVLEDVVGESYTRIGKTLDQIGDGGWREGMDYLTYALDSGDLFARALGRVTGGACNLYAHPRLADAVRTFLYSQVPPDRSVHFSDSEGRTPGSYRIFNQLAFETKNPGAAWLRRQLWHDQPADLYDLLQPLAPVEPVLPVETSVRFATAGWVIMRSDLTDSEKVVVAAKACAHDDPHHGHLDAGQLTLTWRGIEFICDHTSAGYDRAYFDEERWNYPLAASVGHNVIFVDGEEQLPGKRKNLPLDPRIGGTVVATRFAPDRCYALLDATAAYPGRRLKGWRRHLVLDKPDVTLVADEVRCDPGAEIEQRFHSEATQEILERHVRLANPRGTMALIPIPTGNYTIRAGEHTVLLAQRNARLLRVPYVGIVRRAERDVTWCAALILPADSGEEADRVRESTALELDAEGTLTITLTVHKKTLRYRFSPGKNGRMLE